MYKFKKDYDKNLINLYIICVNLYIENKIL